MPTPRKPGDPLRIPAAEYNAILRLLQDRDSLRAGPHATRSETILIKNLSQNNCPRFGVLSVIQPLILPTENLPEFTSAIRFGGQPPQTDADLDHFAIAQEPIPAGAIGQAIISGPTIARINVTGESLPAARPVTGQVNALETSPIGPIILWREGGTGEQYAILDLSQRQQLVRFELTAALTPGGVAAAKIRDKDQALDIPITVTDALGIFHGSASAPGIAIYMPDAHRYEILQLKCE